MDREECLKILSDMRTLEINSIKRNTIKEAKIKRWNHLLDSCGFTRINLSYRDNCRFKGSKPIFSLDEFCDNFCPHQLNPYYGV